MKTDMKAIIRLGDKKDLNAIYQFDQHVKESILIWKLMNKEIVLAELNEEILGYLRLEYLWSKYPYIGLVFVHSEYRNQGIGRAILNYLEEQLIESGQENLYSSSQVDESEPQKWHRRMGFIECGIINGINAGNVGEVFFNKKLNKNKEHF